MKSKYESRIAMLGKESRNSKKQDVERRNLNQTTYLDHYLSIFTANLEIVGESLEKTISQETLNKLLRCLHMFLLEIKKTNQDETYKPRQAIPISSALFDLGKLCRSSSMLRLEIDLLKQEVTKRDVQLKANHVIKENEALIKKLRIDNNATLKKKQQNAVKKEHLKLVQKPLTLNFACQVEFDDPQTEEEINRWKTNSAKLRVSISKLKKRVAELEELKVAQVKAICDAETQSLLDSNMFCDLEKWKKRAILLEAQLAAVKLTSVKNAKSKDNTSQTDELIEKSRNELRIANAKLSVYKQTKVRAECESKRLSQELEKAKRAIQQLQLGNDNLMTQEREARKCLDIRLNENELLKKQVAHHVAQSNFYMQACEQLKIELSSLQDETAKISRISDEQRDRIVALEAPLYSDAFIFSNSCTQTNFIELENARACTLSESLPRAEFSAECNAEQGEYEQEEFMDLFEAESADFQKELQRMQLLTQESVKASTLCSILIPGGSGVNAAIPNKNGDAVYIPTKPEKKSREAGGLVGISEAEASSDKHEEEDVYHMLDKSINAELAHMHELTNRSLQAALTLQNEEILV